MCDQQNYVVRYGRDLLFKEIELGSLPVNLDQFCSSVDGVKVNKVYGRGHFAEVTVNKNCLSKLKKRLAAKGCELFEQKRSEIAA